MTIPKPLPPVSLQDQAWFAGVLVLYALVELSFNHRMLELTDVVLSNSDLDGVQFWGRIIAGFGLSMLLLRWLDLRMAQRWQAVLLSFALGMTLMWHFQKMVIDHLVDSAPVAEKQLSVYLLNIADLAALGRTWPVEHPWRAIGHPQHGAQCAGGGQNLVSSGRIGHPAGRL